MSGHCQDNAIKTVLVLAVVCLLSLASSLSCFALEPEPRKWNHLPLDANFGGVAYAYTEADILLNPALRLDNVDMTMKTWAGKYIRTFELFEKTARIDVAQGFQDVEWTGLLNGTPARTSRRGLTDTLVRFGINLYGAPPLKGKAYQAYRSEQKVETIVGFGLVMRLPTGHYKEDKLLNIGKNRYGFRPQLGLIHTRGRWMFEVTTEVRLYTKNDDFFDGQELKQDPLYIMHGHLIYTFRPGLWIGAGFGHDYGGESAINGVGMDDRKQNIGWTCSLNVPINRTVGIKLAYIGTETKEKTGLDSNTIMTSVAFIW